MICLWKNSRNPHAWYRYKNKKIWHFKLNISYCFNIVQHVRKLFLDSCTCFFSWLPYLLPIIVNGQYLVVLYCIIFIVMFTISDTRQTYDINQSIDVEILCAYSGVQRGSLVWFCQYFGIWFWWWIQQCAWRYYKIFHSCYWPNQVFFSCGLTPGILRW